MPRLLVPLFVLFATAVPAATADTNARLTLVDRTPLTISGLGFPPGRSVMVQVVTPQGSERRMLRTTAAGRIRATFAGTSLTGRLRCAVGVVIAARITGGDVVLWSPKLPDCPSPLRPPATGAKA